MIRSFLTALFLLIFITFLTSCKEDKKLPSGFIDADYVYISPYSSSKIVELNVKKGQTVKKHAILFKMDGMSQKADVELYSNASNGLENYIKDMQTGARSDKIKTWTNIAEAIKFISEGTAIGDKMYTTLEEDKAVSFKDQQKIAHIHKAALKLSQGLRDWVEYIKLPKRSNLIAAAVSLKTALNAKIEYSKWLNAQVIQKSPVNALVFDTFYESGEFVQAGKPVVSLLAPENIKAVFFITGDTVEKLKLGSKVSVITSDVKPVSAEISYISPKPEYTDPFIYSLKNNKKYMYMIEARFAAKDSLNLHPGQPIEVNIN